MKTQANFNDLVYIYDVLLYPFDDATPNAEKARQAAKFLQEERLSVKAALLECKKLERITDNNVWLGLRQRITQKNIYPNTCKYVKPFISLWSIRN